MRRLAAAPLPVGWRWVVLVGSATAAYLCVPETDQYRAVLPALVLALFLEVIGVMLFPRPWLLAAYGMLAWAALYGATGRPSAVIGGVFSLLVPPVAAWAGSVDGWRGLVVGGIWTVAAVAVARTGGIATTARPAWIAAAIGGVVAATITGMLCRRWRPAPSAV